MKNKLSSMLFAIAKHIDLAIADHARTPESKCRWYCKPGAYIADVIRNTGNKIWKK